MSAPPPLVSVIMPAFNAAAFIAEAIDSILGQTWRDFECIIVDDASTDGTWEVIQQFAGKDSRIIPIRNPSNMKISATLNVAIEAARGKYVARMDADDWSFPDRFEKQVAFLELHPDVVICGGTMEVCNQQMRFLNTRSYHTTDAAIRAKLFRYSPFCHAATMMRREALQACGGYNDRLHGAEDYDLYFRLGLQGAFHNLSDCLYKMRLNRGGISHRNSRRQEWLTLYIRAKAVAEYGYAPTRADILFNIAHLASMVLIPQSLKMRLFNRIRAVMK